MKIRIETDVKATPAIVWDAWITPQDIKRWHFASDEWCCPSAEINLEVGGKFNFRMEAKDGSMGFDFIGEFIEIVPFQAIQYKLEDDREVKVEFIAYDDRVKVIETFDAEDENTAERQKEGWLRILENFKVHVESKNS